MITCNWLLEAVMDALLEDYAQYRREALLLGYKLYYLEKLTVKLRKQGSNVSKLEGVIEKLRQDYVGVVEDLDAFFESQLGKLICEFTGTTPAKARERARKYVKEIILKEIPEIKRKAKEETLLLFRGNVEYGRILLQPGEDFAYP